MPISFVYVSEWLKVSDGDVIDAAQIEARVCLGQRLWECNVDENTGQKCEKLPILRELCKGCVQVVALIGMMPFFKLKCSKCVHFHFTDTNKPSQSPL